MVAEAVTTAGAPEVQSMGRGNPEWHCSRKERKEKLSAQKLKGIYVSCLPLPCCVVQNFEAIGEDKFEMTCACLFCLPFTEKGRYYERDTGLGGLPEGPPNSFTIQQNGSGGIETIEFGKCCMATCMGSSDPCCYMKLLPQVC